MSATTEAIPRSRRADASSASRTSTTSESSQPRYAWATPSDETGSPRARISAPAGPLTGASPTMGLTPMTGARVACRAATRPGTARMAPIDVTGFDGQTTTTSASAIASTTPGAGVASPAPAYATSTTARLAFSRTKYSWKSSQPLPTPGRSDVRILVRTGSSLIGRTSDATPWRRASSAVTADSGWPAFRRSVRTRCVARSRSPRLNHVSAPRAPTASRQLKVSSRSPQPRATSRRPASAYVTLSRSGETCSPQILASSPVLTTMVRSEGGTRSASPRMSLAAPVPPARAVTRMATLRARWLAQCPERGAATPGVEAGARPTGESTRQRALGNRDEAETDPHAIETQRTGEDGLGAECGGVVEGRRDELRGDFERLVLGHDDGPVEHHRAFVGLGRQRSDEAIGAGERSPCERDHVGRGPRHRREVEERARGGGLRQRPITQALPHARQRRRSQRGGGSESHPRRRGARRRGSGPPTSCQARCPSDSWRDGTCTRAWRES